MVVDVVQNPQKSNVYCTNLRKHLVRTIRVYSGIMYGCVRYVLRVAQVDPVGGTVDGEMMKKRWSSGAPPVHVLHGN